MTEHTIYQDISVRTEGAFFLGVVGPVHTGKSTFIKRFMETMVIPNIENTYMRGRARDELPQSGSGRTMEFPLKSVGVYLPEWLEALENNIQLKSEILHEIVVKGQNLQKIKDTRLLLSDLAVKEQISEATVLESDLSRGAVDIRIRLPRSLYYQTIREQTGWDIRNDGDLISTLSEMSVIKSDYESLRDALRDVRTKGYGVVMPDSSQMKLEEPQIVRQGGKYSVKLKASAPVIHMLMTNVETEVTPAIGGETTSEDIISFLLEGFDGDVNRIWQSNIFGKPLNDIAEEGLTAKIQSLPEEAKGKLQEALQRILNEGNRGLICILL